VEVTTLNEPDQCCGFGGLFAVKMRRLGPCYADGEGQNHNAAEADVTITGRCKLNELK